MAAYLARRVLQAVAVVVLVTLIVFGLLSLAPGSGTLTAVLGQAGAHQQFLLAYLTWLGRVLHGNLGFSTLRNVSVGTLLAASLPRTAVLTGVSTLIALLIAVPIGLVQAVRRNTATDRVLRIVTYVCYGMPTFVLGALLLLFLAVDLRLFAAEGPQATGIIGFATDLRALTLPVLTLTLMTVAIFGRYMRSSALDNLAQEYVEAARARGAGEGRVLLAHVLRNSLVPVVTLLGLSLPQIVGGAVLVESLFNIQGMGWQIWEAALHQDAPVTLGFSLVIGVAAAVGSLLADIGYALLDPRVRYAQS
jgi:peptide/nickel transport system permease protein